MASITKHARGWRAQLYVRGTRESATFRTRREAEAWAAQRESELRGNPQARSNVTLGEVLRRYAEEVSPTKRGYRWESIRLARMQRDHAMPVDLPISKVSPEHIAAWRDARKAVVQAGSVIREMNLLSSVFQHARREWRLLSDNPVRDVRRPSSPAHRTRTITWREARAACRALGYRSKGELVQRRQRVALMFLVALRTGMREGELAGLTWDRVHPDYCQTPHKTGVDRSDLRDVPLEPRARALIERMRGAHRSLVFDVSASVCSTLFRRGRSKAGLSGFTFHDARHAAATRLAKRVDVLTLCKIFGWANTKHALVYFNPSASDIAKSLMRRPLPQSRGQSR